MFNKNLKNELEILKEELYSVDQIRKSLEQEMIVITLSPDGTVSSVNQNFTEKLGITKEFVIGKKVTELTPVFSRDTEYYKTLSEAIKDVKHWAGALEIEKEDGGRSMVESYFSAHFTRHSRHG